jgi:hypothetical protein
MRKSKIFYVGWNGKPSICQSPFFTKKAAVAHGVDCDREGRGIFLVEVPAKITRMFGKSTIKHSEKKNPLTRSGIGKSAA